MSTLLYYEKLLHEVNKFIKDLDILNNKKSNIYEPLKDEIKEYKDTMKELKKQLIDAKLSKESINDNILKEINDNILKDIKNNKNTNLKKYIKDYNIIDIKYNQIKTKYNNFKKEYNNIIRPYSNKKRELTKEIKEIEFNLFNRLKRC